MLLNQRVYIVLFLIIISSILISYGVILHNKVNATDVLLQDKAKQYAFLTNELLSDKQKLDLLKQKSQLLSEIQNINKSKIIPTQLDVLSIIKILESFHNENAIPLQNIELISSGVEDFNIEKLKFYKYAITVKFSKTEIFSSSIENYITKKLPELETKLSLYYIEDFELKNDGVFKYYIKFYFQ